MDTALKIRELSKQDIEFIYKNKMPLDFPPEEIRPWEMFERSFAMGLYTGYGLYENGKLLSYATFTFSNNKDTILLDYYAVDSSLRGRGIGGKFLAELSCRLKNRLILLEVENPKFSKNKEDLTIRERRIEFYKRCGAVLSGITSKVFYADFSIMYISQTGIKSDAEILAAIKDIYSAMFEKSILEDFISLYGINFPQKT